MSVVNDFFAGLVADIKSKSIVLPTLPEVAVEARRVVSDDRTTAHDIAAVIGKDPSLAARVLRFANSAGYRGSTPISDVPHAVSRLGRSVLHYLVLSLLTKQVFSPRSPRTGARLKALWGHSTVVAAISHTLAAHFTDLDPNQAMVAGLLHDIGALPIVARADEDPAILDYPAELDAIIARLHSRLGRAILKSWGLSEGLIAAVGDHEDIGAVRSGPATFADVVTVANLQSRWGSEHRLASEDWGDVPAFARLGVSTSIGVVELEGTRADVQEIRNVLDG